MAYSGGVDSTVLLHLASRYLHNQLFSNDDSATTNNVGLKATYINHHLSEQADAWSLHCAEHCASRNISFTSIDVDVTPYLDKGIEAAARQARYDALIANANGKEIILLGQHLDDQAETVILQLARGAGPTGLSAMPAHKKVDNVNFYRPLLSCSRQQIIEYAKAYNLPWIEDESNASSQFDRNFIRHSVMPQLAQRFPSITHQLSRSASLCADETVVVNEYMQALESIVTDPQSRIVITELDKLSRPTQASFLRYWLKQHGADTPSSTMITNLLGFMSSNDDRQPQMKIGEHIIYRFQQHLQIRHTSDALAPFTYVFCADKDRLETPEFTLTTHPHIPNSDQHEDVLLVPINGVLTLQRGGQVNHKFKAVANRPNKALKAWCKEWGIAPYQRQNIIKVLYNDILIAVYIDHLVLNKAYVDKLDQTAPLVQLRFDVKQQ